IYFDTNLGYKGVDIRSEQDLLNKQVKIESQGSSIICILDIDGKTVLMRFESFSEHAGYSNGMLILPEKILTA
ncbi:MAG TPA: hypothetical protein VF679_02600, partial [Pedobacter sp.]